LDQVIKRMCHRLIDQEEKPQAHIRFELCLK
jgi:hypothetical protein